MSVLLCSLLDFLTYEDVAERLSQNISNELPLYATYYPIRAQISRDDLVMQALVWLCMVWFSALYKNSKWLQYISIKFQARTSSCIRVNIVFHRNKCKNNTQCQSLFLSGLGLSKLIMLSDRCRYKSCLFWEWKHGKFFNFAEIEDNFFPLIRNITITKYRPIFKCNDW